MRPRRMAAENPQHAVQIIQYRLASMRPRRMAAENAGQGVDVGRLEEASMRPRRMAAENIWRSRGCAPRWIVLQ